VPRPQREGAADSISDIFVEQSESVSIRWSMGSASVRHGLRCGAGIRQRARGGPVGFRALDDPDPDRILEALAELGAPPALAPRFASHASANPESALGAPSAARWDADIDRVIAWLEAAARGILTEVAARGIEAEAHLSRQRVRIADAERAAEDEREGARIEIRAYLEDGPGARRRFAGKDAARLCDRVPAASAGLALGCDLLARRGSIARPDGEFPVVFAAGACGALVHEIGHLLEDDHARMPAAPLTRGDRIAPPCVTIVDDPAACEGRGSYRIDDEGAPPRARILVEQGVFVDTLGAVGDGSGPRAHGSGAPTPPSGGHSRRASYRDLPLPRMACTFLVAGEDDPAAILTSTRRGLFVQALRAGDVDPVSGHATLIVDGGSLIEDGQLTRPLGECLLAVRAKDLLVSIDAVGSNLAFDFGTGSCVKGDQAVSVIAGHPTFRVRAARVIAP